MNPTTSRREQNRADNYRLLLRATLKAFATHGYEGCSVRDIIEPSGLSRGTFYNYFGDKRSALVAVAADILETVGERVGAARSEARTGEALIADAFRAMVQVLTDDPDILGFITRNREALRAIVGDLTPTATVIRALRDDLARAMDAGRLPAQDPDWLAAAMVGATIEVVLRLRPGDDPMIAGDFLTSLFLRGLDGAGR
jgi:AcrR family transcriptional regulator